MREIGTLENGRITEFRVLGLGKGAELGASIAIELEEKVYCPINDFRGNIICLVDASQNITESYRYTAFGECEVNSLRSMPTNPWRFASKRCDPETGFNYFLNRYYSPTLGRWLTPDPLGFADGPNIYAYVHNNPMTKFDLYGLFCIVFAFEPIKAEYDENGELDYNKTWQGWLQNLYRSGDRDFSTGGMDYDAYALGCPYGSQINSMGNKFLEGIGKFCRQLFSKEPIQVQGMQANVKVLGKLNESANKIDQVAKKVFHPFEKNSNGMLNEHNSSFAERIKLHKSLTSQAQMRETGVVIAGPSAKKAFRNAPFIAAKYGGNPDDWVKMKSSTYTAEDGLKFRTHWTENVKTGERLDFKTKLKDVDK